MHTHMQLEGKPMIEKTLGSAVDDGTIANETLAYFVGRTAEFLQVQRVPHCCVFFVSVCLYQ